MPVPDNPRARLKKSDGTEIAAVFAALGYRTTLKPGRIEVHKDQVYIGGFYWRTATDDAAGAWHFYLALTPLHCWRDLQTATNEVQRVQRLIGEVAAAWNHFNETKSDKRWTEYRGIVAAMFLRQDLPEPVAAPPPVEFQKPQKTPKPKRTR